MPDAQYLRRKIDGKFYHQIKAFDYGDRRGALSLARRLREHGTYKSIRIILGSPTSRYFGKIWIVYGR